MNLQSYLRILDIKIMKSIKLNLKLSSSRNYINTIISFLILQEFKLEVISLILVNHKMINRLFKEFKPEVISLILVNHKMTNGNHMLLKMLNITNHPKCPKMLNITNHPQCPQNLST